MSHEHCGSVWKAGNVSCEPLPTERSLVRPLWSQKMPLLIFPGHPSNGQTGNNHAFEAKLGEHFSSICGDVLHFLHERGSYVSESQYRKECSAKQSSTSPTWAGSFQNRLAG
jgi:hypothetical protein